MSNRKRRKVLNEKDSNISLESPCNLEESSEKTRNKRENVKYDAYFTFTHEKDGANTVKYGLCKIGSCCNPPKIKMKNNNTSGLKWHLQKNHIDLYHQLFDIEVKNDSQQKIDKMKNFATPKMMDKRFFNVSLVEYVSMKYLPLNFFDDETSQNFYQNVNENLHFPKRTVLTETVSSVYSDMRKVVLSLMQQNSSRISFTVDSWTSIRGKSYYSITSHFIDDFWKLQSMALDFIPSKGKHSGADIASIFFECINECKLVNKIQGITVDNASVNTLFIRELQILMEENDVKFDSENQHFHCFSHVINLAVQDLLKSLKVDEEEFNEQEINGDNECSDDDDATESDEDSEEEMSDRQSPVILRIRNICKKLRKSEQLTLKLKNYCQVFDEKYMQIPLDVSTRWNTTNDMLAAALKMQKSISALTCNDKKFNYLSIGDGEWELLAMLQKFLKNFKQFPTILGGDKYPTLPMVIVGANMLLDNIEKLCHSLDSKEDRSLNDERLIHAFQAARVKLIKYYDLTNWIYGVVLILDPRHKLEAFEKTSWGQNLKTKSYEMFERILKTHYVGDIVDSPNNENVMNSDSDEDFNQQLKQLYGSKKKEGWKTELSNYLRCETASMNEDILEWWRTNANTFPHLASMARDYLAIPASSVPSERLFSKAGLIIRKHRNRLSSKNAEKLLCLNAWFSSPLSPMIKAKLLMEIVENFKE